MGIMFSQPDVDDYENYIEEDPDYCAATGFENSEHSSNMALDAIYSENKLMRSQNPEITRDGINSIKMYLDTQDKISLIYLLFDDSMAEIALQYTIQIINEAPLDMLDEWISYVSTRETKWQLILLEALSMIQHYQALDILGYSKSEINARFFPTNKHTSLYIPLKKKMLYRMLETYEETKMNLFLETIQKDFKLKNLLFKRYDYLEMYLLHWTSIKYISIGYLDNISRALKVMEMYEEAEEFKETNSQINEAAPPREELAMPSRSINFKRSLSVASTSTSSCMQEDRIMENSYVIDPELPGICLIINQENFYPEFEKKYRDLLPRSAQRLEARTGTEIDKTRLVNTFKNLNFTIVEKNDLTHFQMSEVIESTVESVKNHSSLIICILSHGLEGEVYGVNSIPVKIELIKEIMCTKNKRNLQGKPKVLILQSCQGTRCQEVEDNDEQSCAMDGPPSTADLLVFYATIPGFGAIRDKKNGTWFIQSLCDKIDNQENVNCHFDDICTLVQGEVTTKRWTTKTSSRAMVPMKTSTLTKFFYLPRQ